MSDPESSLSVGESEHLRILTALAEGVHPLTGQPLSDDSVYQHAKVLRALQSAISALKTRSQKQSKREGLPGQAGKPWNPREVALLVQDFDSGMSVKQLAEKHQRTRGAIQSRLVRLGKIQPDSRWPGQTSKKHERLLPEKSLPSPPTGSPIAKVPEKDIPF